MPDEDQHELDGFRAALMLMFSELRPSDAANLQMASPTGFEGDKRRKPSSVPVGQTRKDKDLSEEPDDGNRRK